MRQTDEDHCTWCGGNDDLNEVEKPAVGAGMSEIN